MKKFIVLFSACAHVRCHGVRCGDEREEDRVKDSGKVLKEILNIPDDIPQDLLDKAECVIILPSVKKGAFGIGGSYGRGVMICRSGEHYTGKWGAPALYALEGVSIGFQLGGQATDFVLLVMNPKGAESLLYSKVKLGADASAAAGPKGRTAEGATDIVMRPRSSPTRATRDCSPEFRWKARRCVPTAAPTKNSTGRKLTRERDHSRRQGRHSGLRARTGLAARHKVAGEQVRPEVAGVTVRHDL